MFLACDVRHKDDPIIPRDPTGHLHEHSLPYHDEA